SLLFLFNPHAPTYIYTLSLHDALPISIPVVVHRSDIASSFLLCGLVGGLPVRGFRTCLLSADRTFAPMQSSYLLFSTLICRRPQDRKSTRLNSSHSQISYAVFCLKKKK